MDYMITLQNKRGREYLEDREHFHPAKRLCNGPGSCGQIEFAAVVESPMDTWENQKQGLQNGNTVLNHHDPNMVHTAQAGASPQMCPRCMAGESEHTSPHDAHSACRKDSKTKGLEQGYRTGHINHIMGC